MATKTKPAARTEDRRSGTKRLVDKLSAERAEVLALFCKVAGLEPFKDDKTSKHSPEVLQEFCQVMVDYIAAGHFSLYERIVNGSERRRNIAQLAGKLYPRIARTTVAALAFNDKYDTEEQRDEAPDLERDLSKIGEELEVRMELEDELLQAMLSP
ncbi:MAG: sigma D regulator, partial [Acidiferrobacterales bacterium]